MIYRPRRVRPREQIIQMAETILGHTGHSELSLLSLSSADIKHIDLVLQDAVDLFADDTLTIALPSTRVDAFNVHLAELVQRGRRSGLTFAPEAGTERLRQVIHKGVSEADTLRAAELAYSQGWQTIKLYFMIGLPTETAEDVAGITALASAVLATGRRFHGRRARVTVGVSTMVPKPHTPFQWASQPDREEILAKVEILPARVARARAAPLLERPREQHGGGGPLPGRPAGGEGHPGGLAPGGPLRRLERSPPLAGLGGRDAPDRAGLPLLYLTGADGAGDPPLGPHRCGGRPLAPRGAVAASPGAAAGAAPAGALRPAPRAGAGNGALRPSRRPAPAGPAPRGRGDAVQSSEGDGEMAVPKRYEDEIRDILKGLNEFPGEAPRRQRRRWSPPSLGRVRLDPQRVMGGALILMLFAWILRGPWNSSFPWLVSAAGYISLISIVLFVVALVMLVRGGSFGRGQMSTSNRWRGQVIEMPRRGSPLTSLRQWWQRLRARFSRSGGGPPRPRGRDSFQW